MSFCSEETFEPAIGKICKCGSDSVRFMEVAIYKKHFKGYRYLCVKCGFMWSEEVRVGKLRWKDIGKK